MPAKSKAQRRLMAMAENDPDAINHENKGILSMSKNSLSDFSSTPETNLSYKVKAKTKNSLKSKNLASLLARRQYE